MNKDAKIELLRVFYKSHGLTLSWYETDSLQRYARQAQNNAVLLCNEENYVDKRDRILANIKKHLSLKIGAQSFSLNGDPRGYVMELTLPDGFIVHPEHFN